MIEELYNRARATCAVCNAPILDRPRTCSVCGKAFCNKHLHCVTLVKTKGSDVAYACNDCITKDNLKVIDPNHPLYLR